MEYRWNQRMDIIIEIHEKEVELSISKAVAAFKDSFETRDSIVAICLFNRLKNRFVELCDKAQVTYLEAESMADRPANDQTLSLSNEHLSTMMVIKEEIDIPEEDMEPTDETSYTSDQRGNIEPSSPRLLTEMSIDIDEFKWETVFAQEAVFVEPLGPSTCTQCPKKFARKAAFHTHMRSHEQHSPASGSEVDEAQMADALGPYSCDFCSKKFKEMESLHWHSRMHPKQFPFKCSKCERRFLDNITTEAHENLCQGAFKCEICNKLFRNNYGLQVHLVSHSAVKQFKCDICAKTFNRKDNLRQHTSFVHSKERKFKCHLCGKSYKHKKALVLHSKSHHTGISQEK